MTLSNLAHPRRRAPAARRVAAFLSTIVTACAGAVALGGIVSCGGGTSQVDTFNAGRVLVFGDDDSTLTTSGRSYSVNGLNSAGAVDCTVDPIWVQQVASLYGFGFAQCNPNPSADPQAFMLAAAGAKVADVAAQVEQQVSAGGFRDKDLATVLAGKNDILELYGQFPGRSQSDLQAEAGARGAQLAQVVNRLVSLGVKVILSDVPDVGLTPYAIAQQALDAYVDRAAVLSALTTSFNEQLGVSIVLDGRYIGLVQAQLRFQGAVRSPSSFGVTDVTDAVCTATLPNCTTATLVSGATASQYLWADATRLAPGGHAQLASLAVDRARRNPF